MVLNSCFLILKYLFEKVSGLNLVYRESTVSFGYFFRIYNNSWKKLKEMHLSSSRISHVLFFVMYCMNFQFSS